MKEDERERETDRQIGKLKLAQEAKQRYRQARKTESVR